MSNPLEAVIEVHGLERWSQLNAVRVCLVESSARRTLPGPHCAVTLRIPR